MKKRIGIILGLLVVFIAVTFFVFENDDDNRTPNEKVVSLEDDERDANDAPIVDEAIQKEAYADEERISLFVEIQNDDGVPIVGAEVSVTGRLGAGASFNEVRDVQADGSAVFEEIPSSLHGMEIVAKGYVTRSLPPPHLPKGVNEASVSFVLQRSKTVPEDEEEELARIGKEENVPVLLSGVVLSDGKPVANAQILKVGLGEKKMPTGTVQSTDVHGRFFFPSSMDEKALRSVDTMTVLFHASHGVQVLKKSMLKASSREVGTETVLVLPPGGYLEGKVFDDDGELLTQYALNAKTQLFTHRDELGQLNGVTRRLLRTSRGTPALATISSFLKRMHEGIRLKVDLNSNSDGTQTFRIGPMPAGRIVLTAESDDATPTKKELELTPGETLTGVELRLEGPLYVSGQVTDIETDAPISNAKVQARLRSGLRAPGFGSAITDEEGYFRIGTQAGVRHTLVVSKGGYTTFEQGGFSGGQRAEKDLDVKLRKAKGKGRGRRQPRDYVGIGAQLRRVKNIGIVVDRIFKGGAAAEHLQKGDVIVAVDREDVEGEGLRAVVQLILGEPDTDVELTILPGGKKPEKNVTLWRKRVSTER